MTGSDSSLEVLDDSVLSDVRDPYAVFAAMRAVQPVTRIERPQYTIYLTLNYRTVSAVLRDPETFSSGIMSQVMGPVMGRTILEMDGREHTQHRGLVSHAFRPRAIEQYAVELVEPVVHEMIDAISAADGRAELVAQLTTTYPLTIIARMLGVAIEDYATFQQWSLDIIGYKPWAPDAGLAASRALRGFLAPILAARKREPRRDLISELLAADVDGVKLTDEEIFGFLLLLLPAGAETTFRLLGNLLFALLTHPQALERARADAQELHWALEETLRWEPPLLGTARVTTRDTALDGIEIPAGSMVSAMVGPANHDPEHYSDPDRFDLDRRADDHLSFGLGKHFCLGYHLARLEVLTAARALLDRLTNLRLDPQQESYIRGVTFRSPNALPVLFDPH